MPDYDFHTLSPIDFEILVRDLLQEHLKVKLENFKAGRDQGIDLRYAPSRGKELIVQCKHYTGSSYKALLGHLKREEVEKVRKLNPSRYLLATSLGLTPAQKDGISRLFSPFIKSPEDVYGREDLNNLLGLHGDVEKRTFKLWFSSTRVFEEILQTRVHNLTRETLAKIQMVARYYVQNDSFGDALRILDDHNYCIVAGIPGIGKTTLSEMLLLHYVALGYEIAKIEGDIAEASEVDYTKRKRVFYYDDFLGQSSLADKLDKNEDQRLLDFMEAIRCSKVSKLILTTREYILNQAKLVYEKIDRTKFEHEMCIIDLSKYTRLIRAKILFNHVYFSSMPPQYKAALTSNRNYLKIIDHDNYSPRIVAYMTDYTRVSEIQPSEYVGFFIANLDNPAELWRHAFESQLSQAARDLLVVLVSMPGAVFLEDLELAYRSYHDSHAKAFAGKTEPQDFKRALKELDGNFIKTERSREQVVTEFHNPSVRDFLQNYLIASPRELDILVKTVAFFDQLEWLWQYRDWRKAAHPFRASLEQSANTYLSALRQTLATSSCHLANYKESDGQYRRERVHRSFEQRALLLISIAGERKSVENTRLIRGVMKQIEERLDQKSANQDDLARALVQLKDAGFLKVQPVPALLLKAKEYLKTDITWIEEVEPIAKVLDEFPEMFSQGDKKEIADIFESVTKDYVSGGGSDDPDVLRRDIEHVESLAKKLKVDMSDTIKELESQAEELEADTKEDPPDEERRSKAATEEWCSNEEIQSIFDCLESAEQ